MPTSSTSPYRPLHVGQPYIPNRERLYGRLDRALDGARLTNDGPLVRELEGKLESYLGVPHVICVSSGTVGLELAAKALGLHGEVIVPSWTFVATANALRWVGLDPVFADVGRDSQTLDPSDVLRRLTTRTTAILGVHTWGWLCDEEALTAISNSFNLHLFYDAAHAFSPGFGIHGECEVFSFHATKCFHTVEGGAVITADPDLASRLRLLRNFGFDRYDHTATLGINAKMSEFHAAMGLGVLEEMDSILEANRHTYEQYREALPEHYFVPGSINSSHQYVVALVEQRDRALAALWDASIYARRYFYPGVHRLAPYSGTRPTFLPATEWLAERVLVLPAGPSITQSDIDRIATIIRSTSTPVPQFCGDLLTSPA